MTDLPKSVAEHLSQLLDDVGGMPDASMCSMTVWALRKLCALAAPNAKLREAAVFAAEWCEYVAQSGEMPSVSAAGSRDCGKRLRECLSAAPEAAKDDEVAELRAKLEAAEKDRDSFRAQRDAFRNQVDDARDASEAAPDESLVDACARLSAKLEATERQLATAGVTESSDRAQTWRENCDMYLACLEKVADAADARFKCMWPFLHEFVAPKAKLEAAEKREAELVERLRKIAQRIVGEIGACGPENADEAVSRLLAKLADTERQWGRGQRDLASARADQRAVAVEELKRVRKFLSENGPPLDCGNNSGRAYWNELRERVDSYARRTIDALTAPAAEQCKVRVWDNGDTTDCGDSMLCKLHNRTAAMPTTTQGGDGDAVLREWIALNKSATPSSEWIDSMAVVVDTLCRRALEGK